MGLLAFYGMVVTISLSGVMAPGPITALTLARGRHDALAGFWINTGHAITETPLILVLLTGLGPFLDSTAINRTISLAGGGVLLWMGMGVIKGRASNYPDLSAGQRGLILEGIAMTAFNPYWLVWWLTVGVGLIARAREFSGGWIIAGMVAIHLVCDFTWGTFLSWAAHRSGGAFRPEEWRRIEIGCGGVLIAFGTYFLYEGV